MSGAESSHFLALTSSPTMHFHNALATCGMLVNILVDFHYCEFINHLGVAFLGGLACAIQARGGRLTFDWDTLSKRIGTNLAQNGFLYSFGCEQYHWDGNSIPYRSDLDHDFTEIGDYLRDKWLGKGWVNISAGLQNAIAGQVSEIYLNAFEHSRSAIGVFSCGQHYPRAEMLYLTVVDFGMGIPTSVRSFLQNEQFLSTDALEWAFRLDTTTPITQGIATIPMHIEQDNFSLIVLPFEQRRLGHELWARGWSETLYPLCSPPKLFATEPCICPII